MALAVVNSIRRTACARLMSTAAYPFSSEAVFPKPLIPEPQSPPPKLLLGKGLQQHVLTNLPTQEKQALLHRYFSRHSVERLLPGSVLTVTQEHAPTSFSGVLISVRRRGPDTSFVLRNIVQKTGVEMQFYVNSPHMKDIKVVQRAGGGGGKEGRRMRRAKLFYLRDSPEKMTSISLGVRQ
jgi:large subunit ribosomal protein L19